MTRFEDVSDRVYAKAEAIVQREIAGETLLVPVRGKLADMQRIFALDEVPVFIWDKLDGVKTVAELRDAIVNTFDVEPEHAACDLVEFIEELSKAGLVESR